MATAEEIATACFEARDFRLRPRPCLVDALRAYGNARLEAAAELADEEVLHWRGMQEASPKFDFSGEITTALTLSEDIRELKE